MIVSVSIILVGSVKIKLMRYFESSEITRYNMLNQQGISQQNIAIFYLMVRYCIVKQSAVLRAGNDSNLLIVFYVQIMPDDFVMQLHRF